MLLWSWFWSSQRLIVENTVLSPSSLTMRIYLWKSPWDFILIPKVRAVNIVAASRQMSTGPGNKLVKIIENYDWLLLLIDMEMVWGSAHFHEQ